MMAHLFGDAADEKRWQSGFGYTLPPYSARLHGQVWHWKVLKAVEVRTECYGQVGGMGRNEVSRGQIQFAFVHVHTL